MIFCVCLHTALNQYQVRPRGWLTVVSPLQVPSCYHTSSCWCSAASPSSSSSCPSVSSPARGVWEYGRSAPCSKVSVSMFVQSAYREQIHYMVIWGFWLGQGSGGGHACDDVSQSLVCLHKGITMFAMIPILRTSLLKTKKPHHAKFIHDGESGFWSLAVKQLCGILLNSWSSLGLEDLKLKKTYKVFTVL